jgi:hypothetical protein
MTKYDYVMLALRSNALKAACPRTPHGNILHHRPLRPGPSREILRALSQKQFNFRFCKPIAQSILFATGDGSLSLWGQGLGGRMASVHRLTRSAAAAFLLTVSASAPACAQWFARAQRPDVFGKSTVIAEENNPSGDGLVVQCDTSGYLGLALISPGTPSELDQMSKAGATVPAKLLVKVDSGAVKKFDAQFRQWNNTYLAVAAEGRTPDLVATIRAIGAATDTIDVGTDILGDQESESFDATGSTAAMNTVVKDCKLDEVAPPPAAGATTPTQ